MMRISGTKNDFQFDRFRNHDVFGDVEVTPLNTALEEERIRAAFVPLLRKVYDGYKTHCFKIKQNQFTAT